MPASNGFNALVTTPASIRSTSESLNHGTVVDIPGHDLGDRLITVADRHRLELHRRARDTHGTVDP
jgi:hypothetical protein